MKQASDDVPRPLLTESAGYRRQTIGMLFVYSGEKRLTGVFLMSEIIDAHLERK